MIDILQEMQRMNLLYFDTIQTEQTTADKKSIQKIYHFNAVHYVISGKGYFNGKLLQAGDGFFCFKNDFVQYAPDPQDPWKYVWLRMHGEQDALHELIFDPTTGCFRFCADDLFFQTVDLITSHSEEMLSNPRFSDACLKMLFSRHVTSDKKESILKTPQTHAESAKNYILSHFHHHITPEKIASELNISRAYLRNIFFKEFHLSPRDFIIQVRIERAKKLLLFENVPIKEISHSVGYDDVLQFFKIFKKHTGVSPTDYRKQALR